MKWIAVRDVLPPVGRRVLGYWYGDEYEVVRRDASGQWLDQQGGIVYLPSHWMPLPDAPTGEAGDPRDVTQR